MNIRSRLARLERASPKSGKHYLFVEARDAESQDEALQRCLDERGITQDDMGYALMVGGESLLAERDFGGYERREDLMGWREAGKAIEKLIEGCRGSSPQDMIRRREQNPAFYAEVRDRVMGDDALQEQGKTGTA